ncbi:MAG: hypothetical protein ACRDD4_06540 [Culicoidibacterales bacterium]
MMTMFESFIAGIVISSAIWLIYTLVLLRVIEEKSRKVVYLSKYLKPKEE